MPLTTEENQNESTASEQDVVEQMRKAKEAQRQRLEEAKARIRARSAEKAKTYVIKAGDTLGKIAQDQYGDGSRWKEIWEANRDAIPNPDLIEVGQEITIP